MRWLTFGVLASTVMLPALAAGQGERQPVTASDTMHRYVSRLDAYEPMYFSLGWRDRLNAKFQLSFKYRFVSSNSTLAQRSHLFSRLFFGYTQTSLWDLESDSRPFYDTSYRPSLFLFRPSIASMSSPGMNTGIAIGVEHESNGQGGAQSRSLNVAFVRPVFTFPDVLGTKVVVSPKLYAYLGDLADNPDLREYRGFLDLKVEITDSDNDFKVALLLRKGTKANHGSLQVDVTYPLDRLFFGNFDAFAHLQYFYGWGESLRSYDQKLPSQLRLGLMIIR